MAQQYPIQQYGFQNAQVIVMDDIPDYDIQDYDLFNEKDFKKYIEDIERLVRSSREYREAIQYMRKYINMNSSLFFRNVNNIESTKIKIELHHYPFTLFDIVITVFNKRTKLQEPLDVELVAKEVAYLHYFLVIGLVPLSKTEHKLVHNQALFIPLELNGNPIVLGDYNKFVEMYEKDIPEDAMVRFNTYKELTANYNQITNTQILEISPTYLKLPGSDENTLGTYNLSDLQQVLQLTQNKVKAITQKHSCVQNIEDNRYDNTNKMIKPFIIGISKGEDIDYDRR